MLVYGFMLVMEGYVFHESKTQRKLREDDDVIVGKNRGCRVRVVRDLIVRSVVWSKESLHCPRADFNQATDSYWYW